MKRTTKEVDDSDDLRSTTHKNSNFKSNVKTRLELSGELPKTSRRTPGSENDVQKWVSKIQTRLPPS
jgi:hypothetical protein